MTARNTRPQPSTEPVADWLQECTDGRVSSHTITMLNAFRRWYDEYRVNPALEAARREAFNTGIEKAVRLVEKRMEVRFAEHGTTEPDANASYYSGEAAELFEGLDEEAEEIISAIRALKENPNAV